MTVTAYTSGNDVVVGYLLFGDNTESGTLNLYTALYEDLVAFIAYFEGTNQVPAASVRYYMRTKVTSYDPLVVSGFQYGFPARYKFGNWRYTDVAECVGPIHYIDALQTAEDFPHETWVVGETYPNNPFPTGSGGIGQDFQRIVSLGDGGRAQLSYPAIEFSYELEPSVVADFAVVYKADVGYVPLTPGAPASSIFFFNY